MDMSTIRKIRILADLGDAAVNPAIEEFLSKLPSGKDLHSIFVKAVCQEIDVILKGSENPANKPIVAMDAVVNNLNNAVGQLVAKVNAIGGTFHAIQTSNLMVLLTTILAKMSGKNVDNTQIAEMMAQNQSSAPVQVMPSNPTQPAPQQAQQQPAQRPQPQGRFRGADGSGLTF